MALTKAEFIAEADALCTAAKAKQVPLRTAALAKQYGFKVCGAAP